MVYQLNQSPTKFRAFERKDLETIPHLRQLSGDERDALRAVSAVLPFRVNSYVLQHLIRWDDVPHDPIYQLTFPQPGMLAEDDFSTMLTLVRSGASDAAVTSAAREIQMRLNPHPAGQMQWNVPLLDGQRVEGMQHKYAETVLLFPSQGQTCHAYCSYCFRWAQFVGLNELKFASRESDRFVEYLRRHQEVSDVLVTGGDPLIMRTALLRRYLEPLLATDLPHIANIRLGTKSLAYWPHRFLTDPDADDLLRLLEEICATGRSLALMAHFSHPRELETPEVQQAIRRIQATGAVIRCQAPLIRHVNDQPEVWADMWRQQVRLGMIPYYLFVERDTGARNYFEVPLVEAWTIYRQALRQVSGLARTVRGPSMSATPGKVVLDGVTQVNGRQFFALRFLQARNPEWVGLPFFAEYDAQATWFDTLRPAWGEPWFFQEDYQLALLAQAG